MPVMIPGSAIGSTSANETASRPKKRKRCTPNAAIEPRMTATSVAASPALNESVSASRISWSCHAGENHFVVSPAIGQLWTFDEVIVTTFTAGANNTLPLWILGNIRLGQQLPEVNVVVLIVLALTIVPVIIAQRLTHESGILRTEQ